MDARIMNPSQLSDFERERKLRASVHVELAIKKMKSGEYKFEEKPCFCGSENKIILTDRERNDIPHSYVVCEECALIRANPRMTAESYARFYNEHYRAINYGFYFDRHVYSQQQEDEMLERIQVQKGEEIYVKLHEMGADSPKMVLDIGCHYGGMAFAFKDKGAEVYGVEIDEVVAKVAEKNMTKVFRSLDEAIASGLKFDFIIMHDVVEHLLDLNDLRKVHNVIAPHGYFYIYTPALFTHQPANLFQIAHSFVFHGTTLEWVMNECKWMGDYLDEHSYSFWREPEGQLERMEKPKEWVQFTLDHISNKEDRKVPPLKSYCKFTRKERYENIVSNSNQGIPDISLIAGTYEGAAMLVSGGPSVDSELGTIKKMKAAGVPLMVIARMYPWAMKHGLYPDFVVTLDSSEEQEAGFDTLWNDTIHFIGSVTRPSIVKKLGGHLMYLFDTMDDPKCREIRRDAGYPVCTVINGGGTAAVHCISILMTIGFRDLHVFGLDCKYPSLDYTHSKDIAGVSLQPNGILEATIGDYKCITSQAFAEFARQTLQMVWVGYKQKILHSIKFHGDSMINQIWDGKFYTEEEAKEKANG